MISRIKALLATLNASPSDNTSALSSSDLQLATAALLIEVATIDRQLDDVELQSLGKTLNSQFSLNQQELDELISSARNASQEASSLYEFTQLINRHCLDDDKYTLVYGLWCVAYADSVLDKHEEHIIRRIADLIHVRHSDFIKAKIQARDEADAK